MSKLCLNKNDFPKNTHYVIIKFSSIHIPGDERSRTHPGHGYPAYTENITHYYAYDNFDEWTKDVADLEAKNKENYIAMKAQPAKITKTVDVGFEF